MWVVLNLMVWLLDQFIRLRNASDYMCRRHSVGAMPCRGLFLKQALLNSCELLRQRKELHERSWNCMQAHGTSCKLMELHSRSWNCCLFTFLIIIVRTSRAASSQLNKPLQGMAPTEGLLSAWLLACLHACLLAYLLACLLEHCLLATPHEHSLLSTPS